MVTKQKARPVLDAQGTALDNDSFDWKCLSTDEKPESAHINDFLLELDTGKGFYFYGAEWQPIGG